MNAVTTRPPRRMMSTLVVLTVALLLNACASAPKPLRGEFADLSPQQASDSGSSGALVRWGGTILSVEPEGERSCFVILGRPLWESARPKSGDTSVGRFLACREGFYDPAIFAKNREITFVGHLDGFENRAIGEYSYRYPRVAADVIYLWPEPRDDRLYYVGPIGWYPSPFGFSGYRLYHYTPLRRTPAPSKPAPMPNRK